MDASWVNPLISGAAGVLGAVVGSSATLAVARRDERARREQEHAAAVVGYFAAVNQFAMTYGLLADLLPADARFLERLRGRLQLDATGELLVKRLFGVTDVMWAASGRIRAIASAEELAAVQAIEDVIVEWQIGTPMPDDWPPAVQRLRELVEALGETG